MKVNDLVAIDVHTHAEVSCRQPAEEDPADTAEFLRLLDGRKRGRSRRRLDGASAPGAAVLEASCERVRIDPDGLPIEKGFERVSW